MTNAITTRHKYPKIYHVPWSPGISNEDRVRSQEFINETFAGIEVVVTEKLDGENTTIYPDGSCHARSVDSKDHPSRHIIKVMAANIGYLLLPGYRVIGENVYAKHSIGYDKLDSFFKVFALVDEHNTFLAWDTTVDFANNTLGFSTVPVLYRGLYDESKVKACFTGKSVYGGEQEGYVIRVADAFHISNFGNSIIKYVRANHVQTDEHWMSKPVVVNGTTWRDDAG
jgi:hypothetical protein